MQPLNDAAGQGQGRFQSRPSDEDAKIAAELPKLEKAVADAKQAVAKAAADARRPKRPRRRPASKREAVAAAAAKAGEAVAKLPDDKVLAEAAGKIAARAEELAAAAESAAKAAAEKASQQRRGREAGRRGRGSARQGCRRRGRQLDRLQQLEAAELIAQHGSLPKPSSPCRNWTTRSPRPRPCLDYSALAKTDPVKAAAAWTALVERWTIAGQIAPLKPLTPEQFAASSMQATGMLKGHEASAVATIEKTPPEPLKNGDRRRQAADEGPLRRVAADRPARQHVAEFVKQYGGAAGPGFPGHGEPGPVFRQRHDGRWLAQARRREPCRPAGESRRCCTALADEMYAAVFSRPATESEKQQVAAYLKDRTDKPVAIGEMVWALLSSRVSLQPLVVMIGANALPERQSPVHSATIMHPTRKSP